MDLARSILAVNTNRYGGDFFQSRHKSWTRVSMRLRFTFWVRICKFIFFESCNFVSCFTHTHTRELSLSPFLTFNSQSLSLSTLSLPHSLPSPSLTLYHLPPSLTLSHVVYHLFTPFLSNTQISNLQSNYLYEVPMYSLSLLSLWWPFLSLSLSLPIIYTPNLILSLTPLLIFRIYDLDNGVCFGSCLTMEVQLNLNLENPFLPFPVHWTALSSPQNFITQINKEVNKFILPVNMRSFE